MRNLAVALNGYSRIRTCDTSVKSRSLSQLSYTPVGCLLMTPFTLSALGYADYTKYRLLNLFCLFCRSADICVLVPIRCKADRALNHLRTVQQSTLCIRSRVQESNLSTLRLSRHKKSTYTTWQGALPLYITRELVNIFLNPKNTHNRIL